MSGKDNHTEICPMCHGSGEVKCSDCNGTGNWAHTGYCSKCQSSGTERCGYCGGSGEIRR